MKGWALYLRGGSWLPKEQINLLFFFQGHQVCSCWCSPGVRWGPQLLCGAGEPAAPQCRARERQKRSRRLSEPAVLAEKLAPGWTGKVWKAVKSGACWHLRLPFAAFWIFYPSWGFMHKDACYWMWWIDAWLQGYIFFSWSYPVTSNFQVWKLLWYLHSGLARLVRCCVTQNRASDRVLEGAGAAFMGLLRAEGRAGVLALLQAVRLCLPSAFGLSSVLVRAAPCQLGSAENVLWSQFASWVFHWRE